MFDTFCLFVLRALSTAFFPATVATVAAPSPAKSALKHKTNQPKEWRRRWKESPVFERLLCCRKSNTKDSSVMSLTDWFINSFKSVLLPCCITVTPLSTPSCYLYQNLFSTHFSVFMRCLAVRSTTTNDYFVTFCRANVTDGIYGIYQNRCNPGKVMCHSASLTDSKAISDSLQAAAQHLDIAYWNIQIVVNINRLIENITDWHA